jgi:hypothetical protein
MKPERLIPVTSESQLRVGMIVVSKGCKCVRDGVICGRPHRQMILGRTRGLVTGESCWATTKTGCVFPVTLVTRKCIPEGRLFRVDDGMDAETRGAKSTLENVR